jgi:hypothetical protein
VKPGFPGIEWKRVSESVPDARHSDYAAGMTRHEAAWKGGLALAPALMLLAEGCGLFARPQGQIEVQLVSWPLVKQLAEPNAGLAGQTVFVQRASDRKLIAEQTTDATGILLFQVPAGSYVVHGLNQSEAVRVEANQVVRLKWVEH